MTMLMSTPKTIDFAKVMLEGLPSVAVLGLGRSGAVAAACLASAGHHVTAVDGDPARVAAMNAGRAPVDETGLLPLIEDGLQSRRLRASTSVVDAVATSDVTLVELDLTTAADDRLDLDPIFGLADAVGIGLALRCDRHTVIMRSAVPPGTTLREVVPRIEVAAGMRMGRDFGVAMIPSFLRPGRAVSDFLAPSRTVIGTRDRGSIDTALRVFATFDPVPTLTSIDGAEMAQQVHTAWRATRSSFGAVVSRKCDRFQIAPEHILELGDSDLSRTYPGAQRPVRVGHRRIGDDDDDLPLLAAVLAAQEGRAGEAVLTQGRRPQRVGILGLPLARVAGESSVLALIAALREAGVAVLLHDARIPSAAAFAGRIAGLRHASPSLRALPFTLESMLRPSAKAVVREADVLIVAKPTATARARVSHPLTPPMMAADGLAGRTRQGRAAA